MYVLSILSIRGPGKVLDLDPDGFSSRSACIVACFVDSFTGTQAGLPLPQPTSTLSTPSKFTS